MYGHKKKTNLGFNETIEKAREELKKEGFGVLTEIDVRETMKKKLDIDFENYVILGACNPPFAYKALQSEQDIGLMLPCNVIVYEKGTGNENEGKDKGVFVSAVLPTKAMGMIDNPELIKIAKEIEEKLVKVIDSI